MVQYPMHFKVDATAPAGMNAPWSVRSPVVQGTIPLTIPPEFEGPGGGFSPEDLYAAALANCFVATFKVFAEKSRLAYGAIQCETDLTVDRDERGQPWMAKAHLTVRLTGVEREDLARRLLDRTSGACMILNSVKTEKSFEFVVTA